MFGLGKKIKLDPDSYYDVGASDYVLHNVKKCLYCGSDRIAADPHMPQDWIIVCAKCAARGPRRGKTLKAAVRYWESRSRKKQAAKTKNVKGCAHCGEVKTTVRNFFGGIWYHVRCINCGADGPKALSEELAIKRWNERGE